VADAYLPEEFDHEAAQALGQLVEQVIAEPSRRRDFRRDPDGVARDAGILTDPENEKVKKVISILAGLSTAELRLLSELNQTFINEGLYVETGNPPLMVY
jgi:hypothetical protein